MKKPFETQDQSAVERLTTAAGEHAKEYVDAGVNALNAVSGKTREIGRNADDYVRDNRWIAIGVAVGIGVVIGFVIRGRRES